MDLMYIEELIHELSMSTTSLFVWNLSQELNVIFDFKLKIACFLIHTLIWCLKSHFFRTFFYVLVYCFMDLFCDFNIQRLEYKPNFNLLKGTCGFYYLVTFMYTSYRWFYTSACLCIQHIGGSTLLPGFNTYFI